MSVLSTLDSLAPGARATLDELLADDERFLGGIDCRGAFLLRYRPRPKLFLTDRRVIEYRPGFLGGTTTHDRERVGTATVSKGIFFYQLTLSGPGFRRSFRVDPTSGRQFADALASDDRRHIDDAESFGAHASLGNGIHTSDDPAGTSEAPGRRHYGVVVAATLALAGAVSNTLWMLVFGYVGIPVAIYLDIRRVEAGDYRWQPDRGLYLVGALIFPLLAVPMYLYRRHEVVGL